MSAIAIGAMFLWGVAASAAGWPCPQQADVDGDGKVDQVVLSMDLAGVRTAQGLVGLALPAPAVRSICLANLVGADRAEVLVAAKVGATKDRRLGLRLFMFRIEGRQAEPAFLGTRGGGELLGFGVADLDGDGKFEVLAHERDGEELSDTAYAWEGFGLVEKRELAAQVPAYFPTGAAPLGPGPALVSQPPERASVLPALELGFDRRPGKIRPARVKANLAPAVNRNKYRWLPRSARRHLARHGFAVLRPSEPVSEVHSLYLDNQYRGLPSFVSADAALHLTHLLFDHCIQQIERDLLVPVLGRLVDDWHRQALAIQAVLTREPTRAAMERILLRLEIARVLLGAPVDGLDLGRAAAVRTEVERIEAASGSGDQPFGLDYTDFTVRGHYTSDQLLARYFRAYLFLSSSPVSDPVEAALLSGIALGSPGSRAWLARFQAHTRALAGPSAGRTPLSVQADLIEHFGAEPGWAPLANKPGWIGDLERKPLTLLPRAWPLGNDLLLAGVDVDERSWPDPLDVFYALGSDRAGTLLEPEKKRWAPLAQRLEAARARVRGGGLDTQSIAGRWLASLRWLVMPYPKGYAAFQRAAPWADRVLVAAAASWTELRRDTILYIQPPVVWMEGGDEDELPPAKAGFVEPVPELYAELAGVLEGTRVWVEAMGPSGQVRFDRNLQRKPGPARLLADGVELLKFLEACADKQLAGKGLTRGEHEKLSGIGTWFEEILAGQGKLRLDPVPVIADVYFFGDPETGVKRPLLVATGPLDEIVVVAPLGRRTILARGAVSSFWHFRGKRTLSDEDWREMLDTGKAPAQPVWAEPTTRFKVRKRARARARD